MGIEFGEAQRKEQLGIKVWKTHNQILRDGQANLRRIYLPCPSLLAETSSSDLLLPNYTRNLEETKKLGNCKHLIERYKRYFSTFSYKHLETW